MITNATITAHAPRTAATRMGTATWDAAATLSVRCCLTQVSQAQAQRVSEKAKDSTAKLRVLKSDWPTDRVIGDDDKITVAVDGADPIEYLVRDAQNWEKSGGLANFKAYLKAA